MKEGWMKNDEGWRLNDEGWWFLAVKGFWFMTDRQMNEWTISLILLLKTSFASSIFDGEVNVYVKVPGLSESQFYGTRLRKYGTEHWEEPLTFVTECTATQPISMITFRIGATLTSTLTWRIEFKWR